jgi:Icc-related predicted phosphoesterase
MSTAIKKTRILIISDTHCATLEEHGFNGLLLPFQKPLPKADVLIHCGDLTRGGSLTEFRIALDMLREIDAPTKLVIAGNHDLSLDQEYMRGHHKKHDLDLEQTTELIQEARFFWTAPDGPAAQAGITFLDEGYHLINLFNGASLYVYASPYTPAFCDFAFPYEKHQDRFNSPDFTPQTAVNIAQHPVRPFTDETRPVDIMITHGPPHGRLDLTINSQNVGCPHLLRAVTNARPLIHCFGHIHEASGAEIMYWPGYTDSRFVNPMNEALVLDAWRKGSLNINGVAKVLTPRAAVEDVKTRHAVEIDISEFGDDDRVVRGNATLMVNAAIMNARNRPENPPCKQRSAIRKGFINADCEFFKGLSMSTFQGKWGLSRQLALNATFNCDRSHWFRVMVISCRQCF